MTNKLEQAALALLAHWDTPAWRYLKPTGDLMADLREALAEPQVDWKEEAMRLGGLNAKHVGELRKLEAEQAVCKECGTKQAQIDRLMLEYCPEEMTAEQMQEWGNNQRPAEQAEQEPVAWRCWNMPDERWEVVTDKSRLPAGEPLYAAPVRTKDLTDDEIEEVFDSVGSWKETLFGDLPVTFARAVIAKFKEKNK